MKDENHTVTSTDLFYLISIWEGCDDEPEMALGAFEGLRPLETAIDWHLWSETCWAVVVAWDDGVWPKWRSGGDEGSFSSFVRCLVMRRSRTTKPYRLAPSTWPG